MAAYQLYFLNEDDRDVARQDHVCADDPAAIRMGRSLCFEHNIDIWNGARRVARIPQGHLAILRDTQARTTAWR